MWVRKSDANKVKSSVQPVNIYCMDQTKRKIRHHRIRARLQGSPGRPRASVYRSLSRISVQLIDDVNMKTLLAVYGDVAKGQDKITQARAVGQQVGAQAKALGITSIVFDRGGYRYHGRVKAVADAMREAGLEF